MKGIAEANNYYYLGSLKRPKIKQDLSKSRCTSEGRREVFLM
jgi:hypothetical protein